MLIRQSIREIYELPADTLPVYYTGRKYRCLCILRVVWEVFLQHYSIGKTLLHVNDVHFHAIRDTMQEQSLCRECLGNLASSTAYAMRNELRVLVFEK